MERLTKADRAGAVAAAVAQDLNDELTIIISCVSDSISLLEPEHPARDLLAEARRSAQRCAWKAAELLNYTARSGIQPVRTPLETLLR